MHDEVGFLSAIRETPADDTARLVFADWLDEQDDPTCKTKAAFIRLELQMAGTPELSLNRIRWTNKLQKLAAQLDWAWLAVMSHPKLEACRMSFRFTCPKQWERLKTSDAPKVRYCESCQRHVHFCNSIQEARYHANRGDCVALTLALVRKPDDLVPQVPVVAGEPHFLTPDEFEQLREAAAHSVTIGAALPMHELPPPPPIPQWSPQPPREERDDRRPKPRHRKKRRSNHRNIQRENWEAME